MGPNRRRKHHEKMYQSQLLASWYLKAGPGSGTVGQVGDVWEEAEGRKQGWPRAGMIDVRSAAREGRAWVCPAPPYPLCDGWHSKALCQ